ncbi:MAG: type II toxin-antitoxin system RelE/ParE family toxin [Kiritimatiellia bacterium]|jgi:mRNA interferase RelE/StbE|nr:type II toxin-antitoxin system RelE/ParE family toxin [Kiritimatiellia bacterium]MDP6810006.1 type II toxin-antitoxin system RelE/ParE family toxin [Kiritimatiellia bacterium]MDP7024777.1 type II toxin-antitoxin system RelE/ParE family toxin [Kiritimatiellia bacterium]
MTYAVEILRAAQKQLAKIDRQAQARVIDAVRALADNPRPSGCKKLAGRPAWRIRVGSYRVIYEIHDGRLTVLVVAVGDRKDVYR